MRLIKKCAMCGKVEQKPIEVFFTDGCTPKDVNFLLCRKCACYIIRNIKGV